MIRSGSIFELLVISSIKFTKRQGFVIMKQATLNIWGLYIEPLWQLSLKHTCRYSFLTVRRESIWCTWLCVGHPWRQTLGNPDRQIDRHIHRLIHICVYTALRFKLRGITHYSSGLNTKFCFPNSLQIINSRDPFRKWGGT